MHLNRRNFLNLSAITAASSFIPESAILLNPNSGNKNLWNTEVMTNDVLAITVEEREGRIQKAQRLLKEKNFQALVLDAGTSMEYFTGISWWPSERPMLVVIPARGMPVYVCPAFEESRLRELITIGSKVYVWQEDESPYKVVATVFKDAGITTGKIGMEERVRFFIFDGIRKQSAGLNYASGDPITIECRIIKSKSELALMQKANDITIEAMKAGIGNLQEGMTTGEISAIVSASHEKLGAVPDFASVNFGEATAFPHGSSKPQKLKPGDIILMDCGCRVAGYSSDISRTIVFGAHPTARQMEIWTLEQEAKAAGFAAASPGNTCEAVDNAARQVLIGAGLGPGYKLPGLPHRTGHGIGMDGHEWGNIVKGNKTRLEPGMCFSIEPTISIPGEFGVRLEDCVYMTPEGPKWFTQPSPAISQPFA